MQATHPDVSGVSFVHLISDHRTKSAANAMQSITMTGSVFAARLGHICSQMSLKLYLTTHMHEELEESLSVIELCRVKACRVAKEPETRI